MKKLFEIHADNDMVVKLNPYHILSFETRRGRRKCAKNYGKRAHPYYSVIRNRQPWYRRIFMKPAINGEWIPNSVYIYGTDDSKPLYRVWYANPRFAEQAKVQFETQLEEILGAGDTKRT